MEERDKVVHALTAASHLLNAAAHLVMVGMPAHDPIVLAQATMDYVNAQPETWIRDCRRVEAAKPT